MKYLLDTHIVLWYLIGNERLPQKAKELIDDELMERIGQAVRDVCGQM